MSQLGPDQLAQNWSQIASDYERAFEQLTSQFSLAAIQQLNITANMRVLDVACGTGSFSLAAAQSGCEVVATDFAIGMVERLAARAQALALSNVRTAVMDGQRLEFPDASFDIAASIVGVIFFPDIAKGLAELRRVLKPGGRCVVVCWGDPEQFEMMRILMQAIKTAVPDFDLPPQTPVWARLSGAQPLEQALQTAGFEPVSVTTMQGRLEISSAQEFWQDFTRCAPPLAKLFAALGEEHTRATGEVFMQLVKNNSDAAGLGLSAHGCIGIGEAV